MFSLHSMAVLRDDLPEEGLRAGDLGAVVFIHKDGEAYEVEFAEGDGSHVAVITLLAEQVRPLGQGELLHARKRDKSGDAA